MKRVFSVICSGCLLLLPSKLKLAILRFFGARIGKGCYVGFSLVNVSNLAMGDHCYIGHINLIWRLRTLSMQNGSRISHGNWITGASVGEFFLGRNSAVTTFHYLEASGFISIGMNTIIAGRGSHFFTHGIAPNNLDDVRSISIGDWCYLGSSIRAVPGVVLPDGCFVGMGGVLVGEYKCSYSLLVGVPAKVKSSLNTSDAYFNRKYLSHRHHPSGYKG